MLARETVYIALFNLLSNLPGVVSSSRKLKHWTDVDSAYQPALFMVTRGEHHVQQSGKPPKIFLNCDVYLYANNGGDDSISPASILNPILDAMQAALPIQVPTGNQTLGGLVTHAWISGKIDTDEGVLGEQAVVIVPIEVLVTV